MASNRQNGNRLERLIGRIAEAEAGFRRHDQGIARRDVMRYPTD